MDKINKGSGPDVLERNVNALIERRKSEILKRSASDRIIDGINTFAGSMWSVFFHALFFVGWIAWNKGWLGLLPFDRRLTDLATVASIEAIFLTSFVLIGQKRINKQADKWAELDLHIGLLTEHEVTRTLNLVKAIAKKMNLKEAEDEEIEELSKDIHPGNVLDVIERADE